MRTLAQARTGAVGAARGLSAWLRRIPVSPTLAAILAAALVFVLPGAQPALIYDREAILAGEVWRLITGHWVHFSGRHLALDLFVLGMAGMILESRADARWRLLLWLTPGFIGLGLLLGEPRMSFYGGLSGVATAAVVYLALSGLRERSPWRWICLAALFIVAAKAALEWQTGQARFARANGEAFVAVPLSHLLGALCAAIVWWPAELRRTVDGILPRISLCEKLKCAQGRGVRPRCLKPGDSSFS